MDIKAQIINRLLKRNYYLARMISTAWFNLNLHQKTMLVVFQMGKIGSTSVVSALEVAGIERPVLQVHTVTQQGINEMERRYYGDQPSILKGSLLPETRHLFVSYYLHSKFRSRRKNTGWKIVTLVRDPVARNVSEYFYSVDTTKSRPYLPDFYRQYAAGAITATVAANTLVMDSKSCWPKTISRPA